MGDHGRPRRLDGAVGEAHGLVRHIFNGNSGQVGVGAVIFGMVDEGRAPASHGEARAAVGGGDGRLRVRGGGVGPVVKLGEGVGKILGMHELVGRILEAHLPAVRGAGRGRDEEELAGVGQGEVLVAGLHGGVLAKVHAYAVVHDGLSVPRLTHANGGLLV